MALQDATNPMQGISGPGKFAKRTDLEYQSPEYGAGAAMAQQMQGAPLASSPDVRGAAPSTFRRDVERGVAKGGSGGEVTSLYAPTQRPDEPVTHGAPVGAGAGPEALMMNQNLDTDADKARMLSYLPALESAAQSPNSSQAFRNYVRVLRANIL